MSEGRPIVVVCRTDKRSAKAASILQEAGFQDVRVLRGGMERWNNLGQLASNQAPG
jgi:rhodanese-related sulfurtransferase